MVERIHTTAVIDEALELYSRLANGSDWVVQLHNQLTQKIDEGKLSRADATFTLYMLSNLGQLLRQRYLLQTKQLFLNYFNQLSDLEKNDLSQLISQEEKIALDLGDRTQAFSSTQ